MHTFFVVFLNGFLLFCLFLGEGNGRNRETVCYRRYPRQNLAFLFVGLLSSCCKREVRRFLCAPGLISCKRAEYARMISLASFIDAVLFLFASLSFTAPKALLMGIIAQWDFAMAKGGAFLCSCCGCCFTIVFLVIEC